MPGGDQPFTAGFLGPLSLKEILVLHPTLSERTIRHAHSLAASLLEEVTTVPDLEQCGIQVFSDPGRGGGLGFSYGEQTGIPELDEGGTVTNARIHVFHLLEGLDGVSQVHEVTDMTADMADEVARTVDGIYEEYSRLGARISPDLSGLVGQEPDHMVIDAMTLGAQQP